MAVKKTATKAAVEEIKEEVKEVVTEVAASFVVYHGFADSDDKGHEYSKGDRYPRKGYTPSEERIKALSSFSNAAGYPLIGTEAEVKNDRSASNFS